MQNSKIVKSFIRELLFKPSSIVRPVSLVCFLSMSLGFSDKRRCCVLSSFILENLALFSSHIILSTTILGSSSVQINGVSSAYSRHVSGSRSWSFMYMMKDKTTKTWGTLCSIYSICDMLLFEETYCFLYIKYDAQNFRALFLKPNNFSSFNRKSKMVYTIKYLGEITHSFSGAFSLVESFYNVS